MRFLFSLLSIIAPFAAVAAESPPPPKITLSVAVLAVGGMTVSAEIAATPESRRRGLSRRPALPAGRGMLFIFAEPRAVCLWMREVVFPLDAAFIDSAGAITGIARMLAHTENLHCAPGAVNYALEVNAGFLDNAKIGDTVLGLPP